MRRRGDHGRRLSAAERFEIQRRVAAGETFAVAASAVGCSTKSIQRLLIRTGGIAPRVRWRSPLRLSLAEREEISRGVKAGESLRTIAGRLHRSTSTISREVATNGGRIRYRAWRGEERAIRCARRPKVPKLVRCPRLRSEVERLLERRWSLEQIASRLAHDHPLDQEMRVSHEAIYRSLFVQAQGALRKELTAWHCCIGRRGASSGRLVAMRSRAHPCPHIAPSSAFAGYRLPPEVITLAVRWYLRFGLSYRDVEELLAERGIEVDHVTVYRWVQRFALEFAEAARARRHIVGDRWHVDETYLRVGGSWRYLFRATDRVRPSH